MRRSNFQLSVYKYFLPWHKIVVYNIPLPPQKRPTINLSKLSLSVFRLKKQITANKSRVLLEREYCARSICVCECKMGGTFRK